MTDQPILYIIRHGQTDLNAGNSFRGFKDVELDATGRHQAEQARRFLNGVHFVAAYSSDLKRAAETLDIAISGDKGLMPQRLVALRPWNIGDFAGKPKSEANKKALQEYADYPDEPMPEGESLSWFRLRYGNVFKDIVAKPGPILVVQHASNDHELGNILYGDIDALDVEPGGIIGVYRTAKGLEAKILMGQETEKQVAGFVS